MKKIFIIVVLLALTAPPAMAVLSVVDSKHDMVFSGFAAQADGGGNTEVCIFCHTPHSGQTSVTQAPLWNNTPEESVDGDYSVYVSVTTDFPSTVAGINATDARLCLSCHDGSVGEPINQPNNGAMEISATEVMDSTAVLGTDLSNDHPIGMNLGPNPETMDLDSDGTAAMHTIAEIIGPLGFDENVFFGATDDNTMWCSTCHDVHDSDPLTAPFLRISNVGSALCKACHKK